MICTTCGQQMTEGADFCAACGTKLSGATPASAPNNPVNVAPAHQPTAQPRPQLQPQLQQQKGSGVPWIVGGIAVFILCSIIQAIGGSHMFATDYVKPDNAVIDLLMNVTWWPGWIATIVLIARGVLAFFQTKR